MRHRVIDTEADIREAHAGHVLAESHLATRLMVARHRLAQPFADDADRRDMHHIREFPGPLRDVALDCVNERIHTGRGAESFRHRRAHIRIDDGYGRYVMRVGADELAMFLRIRYDIVDRDLGRRARGRRDCDDGQSLVLRRGCALEAAHIGEFRIRHDDGDCFRRIDGRATADGYDDISPAFLAELHAFLDILDRRIRFDMVIDLEIYFVRFQQFGHFGSDLEFHEVLVSHDHDFLTATPLHLSHDFLDCSGSEIRSLIQNHAHSHL